MSGSGATTSHGAGSSRRRRAADSGRVGAAGDHGVVVDSVTVSVLL
jgi:hypothetical protein